MFERTVLATLGLALFVPALPAQRSVEFEGRYWIPQMGGRIRVDQGGVGTDIDARRDLGMPDTNFPEGRFTYQGKGHHRLSFTYTPIDFSGDNAVSRTLAFSGEQYTLGTRVLSDLRVEHLQLSWAYQFIDVKEGVFKLGTVVEANGFLMEGRLRAPNLSPAIDQKEDISAGLPTIGIAMDINPHRKVNIYGQVSGLKAGKYGYFIESDAGVKIRPQKNLFLTAGYRTFNLHVENTPDFARLQIRGPFVGAGVRF